MQRGGGGPLRMARRQVSALGPPAAANARTAAAGRSARQAELERIVQRLLSDAASLGFTTAQIVAAIDHTNGSK